MNNFKQERMNEEVKNKILNEVFVEFAKGRESNLKKGERILSKLYFKYFNQIEDTETKRLIGYNLAWVEYHLNNIDGAKKHIEEIRNIVKYDFEYLEDHKLEYCKILNLYNESFSSKDTDLKYYRWSNNYIAEVYKEIEAYSERAIVLSNVYAIDNDYKKIFDLLKEVIELNDEKVGYYSQELLDEIKDSSLHNEALELINKKGIKIS